MELKVITATGKDKPGLVSQITSIITKANANIVDIEALA